LVGSGTHAEDPGRGDGLPLLDCVDTEEKNPRKGLPKLIQQTEYLRAVRRRGKVS